MEGWTHFWTARFGRAAKLDFPTLLILYRWSILGSVLVVAVVSDALSGPARWVVLAPLAASSLMTLVVALGGYAPLLVLVEVVAGVLLISVSRGPESPFVAYLTVPIVHAALRGERSQLAVTVVAAVVGLVTATSIAGGIGEFDYAFVSEGMLLAALPTLVRLVARRQVAEPGPDLLAALAVDDRALLDQLATGLTYAEIAEGLDVSVETVKVRVARLYRRLGAKSRAEATHLLEREQRR
jgi:DNA-binding CsgD family transcriptional regulator